MTSLPINLLRFNRWLLFAMLGLLHLALVLGTTSVWSRPLLFAHLGLFLLWQPLWRGERELRPGSIALILCASIAALWWLDWWLLAIWVSGLFSLVGGRVFASREARLRLMYLSVMAYLLMVLLLMIVPHLFTPLSITDNALSPMENLLPLLLVVLLFFPPETESPATSPTEFRRTVDFIYSLMLFLLLMLLVLGCLSFMMLAHVNYVDALLRTLFSMALILFALGWLWNPRFGFTGLQPAFSRYLLNVGSPFETWLSQLAETSRREQNPEAFLARAAAHLAALPWLSGIAWQADKNSGSLGKTSRYSIDITEDELHLTFFSQQTIGPAVLLHIHLLTRLLAHFYRAKQHEQHLREMARLQAIYETGARLTHDLKNMLQSLLALTSLAQQNKEISMPALQQQLPVLAQRIEATLAKLKLPQMENDAATQPLAAWWETLRLRHQHADLTWLCADDLNRIAIPVALFDSVADNLIGNAIAKRMQQPGLTIRIALHTAPLRLTVCDDGSAIPAHLADQLLRTVVQSENGLGIGLYQAARWASQLGYQLTLRDNRNGNVCFELTADAPPSPPFPRREKG
jgi:signal transduction histidine kinase